MIHRGTDNYGIDLPRFGIFYYNRQVDRSHETAVQMFNIVTED